MKQLPTAEEFMLTNLQSMDQTEVENAMIEFAKVHVQAALESASEKSNLLLTDKKGNTKTTGGYDAYGSIATVNKQSILNSYPLENIK